MWSSAHHFQNESQSNCFPLSVTNACRIPYRQTTFFHRNHQMLLAVMFTRAPTSTHLVKSSIVTTVNRKSPFPWGKGPTISTPISRKAKEKRLNSTPQGVACDVGEPLALVAISDHCHRVLIQIQPVESCSYCLVCQQYPQTRVAFANSFMDLPEDVIPSLGKDALQEG